MINDGTCKVLRLSKDNNRSSKTEECDKYESGDMKNRIGTVSYNCLFGLTRRLGARPNTLSSNYVAK